MRFQYILHDAGWGTAIISCDHQTVKMTASYLHDTLNDLASSVIAILNGAIEVSAIFMDEPGEHQLFIRRENQQAVAIEVRWYEDWHSWGIGTSDYKVMLSCVTRVAHLRGQVFSALKAVLAEHGEAGYREKWVEHEFPLEQLSKLKDA